MDRECLETFLNEGLSLAEIGRRVGRHEATVAYWVQRHGLAAVNRERCSAKGPLAQGELKQMVREGLSTAQIAVALNRSKTTVRHWLKEYGLETQWGARRMASRDGAQRLQLCCPRHGTVPFSRRSEGGYRCTVCRAEAVSRRRRRIKRILVEEAGGSCCICGYNRCMGALEFHHVARADKRFALSTRGVTRSLEKARAEARKCVLVCANCHVELEAGLVSLATAHLARVQ